MPALFGCGGDQIVEIVAGDNLEFVFTVIREVRLNGGLIPSNAPVPFNILLTNHTQRKRDVIEIEGVAGCRSCRRD